MIFGSKSAIGGDLAQILSRPKPSLLWLNMASMIPEEHAKRRFAQNPKDADFYQNPYAFYKRLHQVGGPVFWEDYGFWCLCEFDAVNDCLRDARFARLPPVGFNQPTHPPHLKDFALVEQHSLLQLEPPKHTRIRKSVNQAFANRRVQEMQAEIEMLANQLIDQFESNGETDLLTSYAMPLPVIVIAKLLGVPTSECDNLLNWSHAMVRVYTMTQTVEEEQLANTAAAEFRQLLLSLIADKRKNPTHDLLSHMVQQTPDALSDDEIVSTAVLLLNAGHEATVHQLGNAVYTLLNLHWHTDWIDNDKQADQLIAEAMRFDAPLHLFTRYAQEAVDIYPGITIEPGEQIALLLGAANRDPNKFENADTFNPVRRDAANVSFGAGLHFCVGTPLAKLEMRIAINTLFKRLGNLSLKDKPQLKDSFHFHGLENLYVRW